MIETTENWEVLAKSNIPQCKRCGQCSGQGGHCAAKMGPPPTPAQEEFMRSITSRAPTLDELHRR